MSWERDRSFIASKCRAVGGPRNFKQDPGCHGDSGREQTGNLPFHALDEQQDSERNRSAAATSPRTSGKTQKRASAT